MTPFAKRLIYKGASYTLSDVYTSRSKAVAEAEYLETTQHADVVVQPRGSSFGVYAFIRRRPARNQKKNPSEVRIVYNRLLGGWFVVRGPHQTPLSGRFDSKEEAKASLMKKNPALMVIGNPRGLSIPQKHQLRIARDTLKMSDVGAKIMGGPTKAEAREIILRLTGQPPKENPKGDLMSDSVHEVRYTHRQDGAPYKHTFKAGVRMVANDDGTITLYHPTKRIHEEFPD